MTKTKTMTKTNTFREHLQRVILETCDQSNETTWPDQKKTMAETNTFREFLHRPTPETFDVCDF